MTGIPLASKDLSPSLLAERMTSLTLALFGTLARHRLVSGLRGIFHQRGVTHVPGCLSIGSPSSMEGIRIETLGFSSVLQIADAPRRPIILPGACVESRHRFIRMPRVAQEKGVEMKGEKRPDEWRRNQSPGDLRRRSWRNIRSRDGKCEQRGASRGPTDE